jgi:N-acetylgalactosamine-6-sulfatase
VLGGDHAERVLYWRKPRGEQIWRGVRKGNWKYVADQRGDQEREYLFHLGDDPSETVDLSQTNSDMLKRLRRNFDSWEQRTRETRRGRPVDAAVSE